MQTFIPYNLQLLFLYEFYLHHDRRTSITVFHNLLLLISFSIIFCVRLLCNEKKLHYFICPVHFSVVMQVHFLNFIEIQRGFFISSFYYTVPSVALDSRVQVAWTMIPIYHSYSLHDFHTIHTVKFLKYLFHFCLLLCVKIRSVL
jgi:hypothetical protein